MRDPLIYVFACIFYILHYSFSIVTFSFKCVLHPPTLPRPLLPAPASTLYPLPPSLFLATPHPSIHPRASAFSTLKLLRTPRRLLSIGACRTSWTLQQSTWATQMARCACAGMHDSSLHAWWLSAWHLTHKRGHLYASSVHGDLPATACRMHGSQPVRLAAAAHCCRQPPALIGSRRGVMECVTSVQVVLTSTAWPAHW